MLELIDPGVGRWWRVELVNNAATKPIKVTLMEGIAPPRRNLATRIAYRRTIATPEAVSETAKTLLAEVGRYHDLVGDYPQEEKLDLPAGWVVYNKVAHYYKKNDLTSLCGDAIDHGSPRSGIVVFDSPIDCPTCKSLYS